MAVMLLILLILLILYRFSRSMSKIVSAILCHKTLKVPPSNFDPHPPHRDIIRYHRDRVVKHCGV